MYDQMQTLHLILHSFLCKIIYYFFNENVVITILQLSIDFISIVENGLLDVSFL